MMCQAFCTCIILQKGKPTWRCCLSSQKLRKNTEPPSWKEVSGRRRGRQAQNQKGSVGWYFQVSQLLALSCSGFTLPFVSIPQALTWTRFLERVTLSGECCMLSEVHLSSHPWVAMLSQVRTFLAMISRVNSCSFVLCLLLGNAYNADRVSGAGFWLSWTWTMLLFSLSQFWFLPCFFGITFLWFLHF